jgi:hypothetical protein
MMLKRVLVCILDIIPFNFSGFEPGDYVLRIDANDQVAGRPIFQEMRITLE